MTQPEPDTPATDELPAGHPNDPTSTSVQQPDADVSADSVDAARALRQGLADSESADPAGEDEPPQEPEPQEPAS